MTLPVTQFENCCGISCTVPVLLCHSKQSALPAIVRWRFYSLLPLWALGLDATTLIPLGIWAALTIPSY